MTEKRVLICPECGQGHPWGTVFPDDLGRLEDWTDYIRYSPQIGSSIGRIDHRKDQFADLMIPKLKTCVNCSVAFRVNPCAPLTSEQAGANTPAGSAGSAHYLEFLKRSLHLSDAEYIDILLEAWVRSNDRLRLGRTEELRDPNRMEILSWIVSCFQNQTGPNRVRAAEAARQSGNFQLAITLLNHQFEACVKPFADFVRDLALLGDVLVRKVALYPDIIAFEKAKARAAENAAELSRAQAAWQKQKETISSRHSGVGGLGCLFLMFGILGGGMLGQSAPLAILTGIVLLLVFFPLSSKTSRQAESWAAAYPKPNWQVLSPTFNESPPVLGIKAISFSARERGQGAQTHLEKAPAMRDGDMSKSSALVETLLSEWRDPSLAKLAQKIKSLIKSNSGMLDSVLLESEKSRVIRQAFFKYQIFAYVFIFTFESKQRHPLLLIGHQDQLIREIKAALPLLAYSVGQLIQEFHGFEASVAELSQDARLSGIKFFFDLGSDGLESSPSLPGYLSHLVCEEAQVNQDPRAFKIFCNLFNSLIEQSQKERPFDQILNGFIQRISVMN